MSAQVGDECPRCYGTGQVYDEVFEYEWTDCPYMDVRAGVACLKGRVVPIDEAIPPKAEHAEDSDE
jgi:hypothetical protein